MHKPLFPACITLLICCLLINVSISYGQKNFKEEKKREIHLNPADRKIDAIVSNKKKHHAKAGKTYYWFDKDAIHTTNGGFAGYLLDGKYDEFYYPSNNLYTSGRFKNGIKEGHWSIWYENGDLKEKQNWKQGQLSSNRYLYNDNGSLAAIEHYKHGKLNGEKIVFTSDTVGKHVFYYKNGLMTTYHKHWYNVFRKNEEKRDNKVTDAIGKEKNSTNSTEKPVEKNKKKSEARKNKVNKSGNTSEKTAKETKTKKENLWSKIKNIF